MSVQEFCWLLNDAKLGKNDKKWFPRWLRRYAPTVRHIGGNLSVTEGEVIAFSRSLLDSKTPAWQRLQAVRAIEAYRNLVLKTDQPRLHHIRQQLSRLAAQHREDRPGVEDERHLVGRIDPREPTVVQQMRRELRLHHKALTTERSYVG